MDILVENIASSVDEEQVKRMFETYGTVESISFVKDKQTGILNGQAYITMPSDDEAERAVAKLDSVELEGQQIRVRSIEDTDFPSGDFW